MCFSRIKEFFAYWVQKLWHSCVQILCPVGCVLCCLANQMFKNDESFTVDMDLDIVIDSFERLESCAGRIEKTKIVTQLLQKTPTSALIAVVRLLEGNVFAAYENKNLGISTQFVIRALSNVSGLSKSAITADWQQLGDLGLVALKVLQKKRQATLFFQPLDIESLFELLLKIEKKSGENSQEAKIQILEQILHNTTSRQAKYVIRLVLEQMRFGVGQGVIRDAIMLTYLPKFQYIHVYDPATQMYSVNRKIVTKIDDESDQNQSDQIDPVYQVDPNHLESNQFGSSQSESVLESAQTIASNEKRQKKLMISERADIVKFTQFSQCILAPHVFYVFDTYEQARDAYLELTNIVQLALDLVNDPAQVASIAKNEPNRLLTIAPIIGQPMQLMLAHKSPSIKEAITDLNLPCACEYKYDGFRVQIHKIANSVFLFTRRLEKVSLQFPEVITQICSQVHATHAILDAEIVGFDFSTKNYLPFQEISTRIRRKHNIQTAADAVKVQLLIFDCMFFERSVIDLTYTERRALLEAHVSETQTLQLSKKMICESEEQIQEFYKKALESGNEGIMIKKLTANYRPGRRVGYMLKIKPVLETLDLVVTQATWGEGKRANMLTSFVVSCLDGTQWREIGRVGTGFSEEDIPSELPSVQDENVATTNSQNDYSRRTSDSISFAYMTQELQSCITHKEGKNVHVTPKLILEIAFEEIQQSHSYSSGFALRFPRVVRLRTDKGLSDVSSLTVVEQIYKTQKARDTVAEEESIIIDGEKYI